jgi:hypothetical protein
MESIMKICRTPAFQLASLDAMFAYNFEVEGYEGRSMQIENFNLADLRLEVLVQGANLRVTDIRRATEDSLTRIRDAGYVFLDAQVAQMLLANPALFPSHWPETADSDSGACIRFDGTRFRSKTSGELAVVQPFFNRGQWLFGWGPLYAGQGENAADAVFSVEQYTAVLKT